MAVSRTPTRTHSILPDISEIVAGFPAWQNILPALGAHPIRVEEEMKEGMYELRAELPGVDPANEVEILVQDKVLTIKSHRSEKKESEGRSEFSYGAFARSVTLPAGADEDAITATYDKGILSVSVPVAERAPRGRRVEIKTAS